MDDIIGLYGIEWVEVDENGVPVSDGFSFSLETCEDAQDILNNKDLEGKNRASDPAYNLAKHLLAYQLNQGAGAYLCFEMVAVEIAAVELLVEIEFDGNGPFLKVKGKGVKYHIDR